MCVCAHVCVCVRERRGEERDEWKLGSRENCVCEEEKKSRGAEAEELSNFSLPFAARDVSRCGDAAPLPLPNRAGDSLGSAADR